MNCESMLVTFHSFIVLFWRSAHRIDPRFTRIGIGIDRGRTISDKLKNVHIIRINSSSWYEQMRDTVG